MVTGRSLVTVRRTNGLDAVMKGSPWLARSKRRARLTHGQPAIRRPGASVRGEEPAARIEPGPESGAERQPDRRARAGRQDAPQGEADRLVDDHRADRCPVDGRRRDPQSADTGQDGVQLEVVDRAARPVRDGDHLDDRDGPARQPERHPDVVACLHVEARAVGGSREDRRRGTGGHGGPRRAGPDAGEERRRDGEEGGATETARPAHPGSVADAGPPRQRHVGTWRPGPRRAERREGPNGGLPAPYPLPFVAVTADPRVIVAVDLGTSAVKAGIALARRPPPRLWPHPVRAPPRRRARPGRAAAR